MESGEALIGIKEFEGEWKVVIGGFSSDFDMAAVFVDKANKCVIKFDDKSKRFVISNIDQRWSKKVAFEKMKVTAQVLFGFIAAQTPCSVSNGSEDV